MSNGVGPGEGPDGPHIVRLTPGELHILVALLDEHKWALGALGRSATEYEWLPELRRKLATSRREYTKANRLARRKRRSREALETLRARYPDNFK